jgi:hypothetical protein
VCDKMVKGVNDQQIDEEEEVGSIEADGFPGAVEEVYKGHEDHNPMAKPGLRDRYLISGLGMM